MNTENDSKLKTPKPDARAPKEQPASAANAEHFVRCCKRLLDGGKFDLTDSPLSFMDNVRNFVKDYDALQTTHPAPLMQKVSPPPEATGAAPRDQIVSMETGSAGSDVQRNNLLGDQRPQRLGWAPGNYNFKCHRCGCPGTGDKRAVLCAPCAYNDEGLTALKAEVERLKKQHFGLIEHGTKMGEELAQTLFKKIEGEYPVFESDQPQYVAMRQSRIMRWIGDVLGHKLYAIIADRDSLRQQLQAATEAKVRAEADLSDTVDLLGDNMDKLTAAETKAALAGEMADTLENLRPLTVGSRRASDYADTHKHERFDTKETVAIDTLVARYRAAHQPPTAKREGES